MRGLLRIGIGGPIIVRHRPDGDPMGRTIVLAGILEATGRQGIQAGTGLAGILETIGPEETHPAGTPAGTDLAGILETIGPEETHPAGTPEGTDLVGIPEATGPEETHPAGTQAGTDLVGILEAIGPKETHPAGTPEGTDLVGILQAIGPEETLEGILRVATGPGQVVGRAVRQAGHLWVVRRAGNDRNRLRVRDRVGLEAITMAQPRRLRAIVAEPVRVAATREVEANEPSQS